MTDSIPVSIEDVETRLRTARFKKLNVQPAKEHMSEDEYSRTYGRHFFQNKIILEQCEQAFRTLFCHKCKDERANGTVVATRFFMQHEHDELGVFRGLMHATCHNCGFEEFFPSENPTLKNEFERMIEERQKAKEASMGQMYGGTPARQIQDEQMHAMQEMRRMQQQMSGIPNQLLREMYEAAQPKVSPLPNSLKHRLKDEFGF